MSLPSPREDLEPPAVRARREALDRIAQGESVIDDRATVTDDYEGIPDHQVPDDQAIKRQHNKMQPEEILDDLLRRKTPEEVCMMTLDRMPDKHTLTTKVGKWTITIRAVTCTVDDTQLNFVADKRTNQCLPDEIAGDYTLVYMSKVYALKLLGVSFFPSPISPFVLVSFLRVNDPIEYDDQDRSS